MLLRFLPSDADSVRLSQLSLLTTPREDACGGDAASRSLMLLKGATAVVVARRIAGNGPMKRLNNDEERGNTMNKNSTK